MYRDYELRVRFAVEMDEKEHDDPLARLTSFAGMYFRDLQVPHRHFTDRGLTLKHQFPTARIVRVRKGLYRVWISLLCRASAQIRRDEVAETVASILNEFTLLKGDFGPSTDGYEPTVESVRIMKRSQDEVAGRKEA